jgi:hypothetical protein
MQLYPAGRSVAAAARTVTTTPSGRAQRVFELIEKQFVAIGVEQPFPGEQRFRSELWSLHTSRWRILYGIMTNLPYALRHTFSFDHRNIESDLIDAIVRLNTYFNRLQSHVRLPSNDDIEFGKRCVMPTDSYYCSDAS